MKTFVRRVRSVFDRLNQDGLSANRSFEDNSGGLVKILGPSELGNNEIVAVELSCTEVAMFWRATGRTVYGGRTERYFTTSPRTAPRVVQIPGGWLLEVAPQGTVTPGTPAIATATILPAGDVFAPGGTVTYESGELTPGGGLAPGAWTNLPPNNFDGHAPFPYVQAVAVNGSVDAQFVPPNPLTQDAPFTISGIQTFVVPDGWSLQVRHPGGDSTSRYVLGTFSDLKL